MFTKDITKKALIQWWEKTTVSFEPQQILNGYKTVMN